MMTVARAVLVSVAAAVIMPVIVVMPGMPAMLVVGVLETRRNRHFRFRLWV